MTVRNKLLSIANSVLSPLGVTLVRKSRLRDLEKKSRLFEKPSFIPSLLPSEAADYLRQDNPRLTELRQKYDELDHPGRTHSLWNQRHLTEQVQLKYFRGDNAYVWQYRDMNLEGSYLLTTYYLITENQERLLRKLGEDGQFGVYTFECGDLIASRDLLDSVSEILFLEENLNISEMTDLRVLDIGAGYGRLAYRMTQALPNLKNYFCADAIAESTFLSEYYLRFRKVDNVARAVPLYDIEETLKKNPVDLALNIHSFTECTYGAVEWWLSLLKEHKVPHLMIVPNPTVGNDEVLCSREADRSRKSFRDLIENCGYSVKTHRNKYKDSLVQRHGVTPSQYYLFEFAE